MQANQIFLQGLCPYPHKGFSLDPEPLAVRQGKQRKAVPSGNSVLVIPVKGRSLSSLRSGTASALDRI